MASQKYNLQSGQHQSSVPAEEQTEQELQLFKFMADTVTDFVGMCDLDFRPFYINQPGLRKVGLDKRADTNDIQVKDFFFPEDQGRMMNDFFPMVKKEGVGETEIRFRHFVTGESFWMLYYVTLLKNNKGEPIGFGTISRDVTKQKLFEEKIIESEERFRNLADQAPMFIWMVDEHAKITYANRALLSFLDIPHYSEVAVQGGWQRVTHPEDVQNVYHTFLQALTNKTGYTVEARLFNSKNNKYEWFLFKATPRVIESLFAGFIGTAVSINEQRELLAIQENLVEKRTQELKVSNDLLGQSNRELEHFAYVASHDLQEPLRKIQMFAQLINERFSEKLDDDVQVYLSKINASASRMTDLINGLLEFSRIAHDKEKFFKTTDLDKVVDDVLHDFEEQRKQRGVTIHKETLPILKAVPLQMTQLFSNLIGNAFKFFKPDVPGQITIKTSRLEPSAVHDYPLADKSLPFAVITIQDNGIGFKQEYAEQIFTIFQRLNDKRAYSGHGIGLALCRKIVENHGGIIRASGEINKGATFTIVLPLSRKK